MDSQESKQILDNYLHALNSRISALETDAKQKNARINQMTTLMISLCLTSRDSDKEIRLLDALELVNDRELSELTTDASCVIAMDSNIFEKLIARGYNLRNMHHVDRCIYYIIDLGYVMPFSKTFVKMFARIIFLANTQWSVKEQNNWQMILDLFDERIGHDRHEELPCWNGIPEETRELWWELTSTMKFAIQKQLGMADGCISSESDSETEFGDKNAC